MDTIFWIIILAFLIPMGVRMYRRSVRGRNQNQDLTGQYPDQYPGQFPGPAPGPKNNEYRDGYTQRDYYGGFGAFDQPPAQQGQPWGQPPAQLPYEDSPEYREHQARQAAQQPPSPAPVTPPPPAGPQGYRARKLAELDDQYSKGEIAMEEYMAKRAEIMNG